MDPMSSPSSSSSSSSSDDESGSGSCGRVVGLAVPLRLRRVWEIRRPAVMM